MTGNEHPRAGGWTAVLLVLIILLGAGVRAVYLLEIRDSENFAVPYAGLDEALYHGLGQRVASGDLSLGPEVYHCSPIYAYTLGGLYAVFGDGPWGPRLLNLLLGSSTLLLLYAGTARLFRSRAAGLIAALAGALYGPLVVFDTSRMKATLGIFLLTLALLLLARLRDRVHPRAALPAGLALGLALSLSGHLLLFVAAACVWAFFSGHPGGLRRSLLLLLGVLLAVLPTATRNYLVAGDLVATTSTGGFHFYAGNREGAWGGYTPVPGVRPNPAGHFHDARRVAESELGRPLRPSEVSSHWRSKAYGYIRSKPAGFAEICAKRLALALNPYEIPNNEDYQFLATRTPRLALLPGARVLFPIGLVGLLFALGRFRRTAPLHLLFFCLLFSLATSMVSWRYRLPLVVALLPFAGDLLSRVGPWVRTREWFSPTAALALAVAIAAFTSTPPLDEPNLRGARRIAEARMAACGREAEIRAALDRPGADSVGLRLDLARLRARQNDLEGALAIFEAATEGDRADPRTRRRVGELRERLAPWRPE